MAKRLDEVLEAGGQFARLVIDSGPGAPLGLDSPDPVLDADHPSSNRPIDVEGMIMSSAEESARHGRDAGSSNVSDYQLSQMEDALVHVAVDLMTEPVVPLVAETRQLRDEAFELLRGRQHPNQARRLYAVASRACGLLSSAAADRFGLYGPAQKHANVASLAADLAQDPALGGWTAMLHSSIAHWQGRYQTAASIAQRAAESLPGGVEAARLAGMEARAWAKLGSGEEMRRALVAAERARATDGPAAGDGVLAYPLANQARLAGTAYLWAGQYEHARRELEMAIELLAAEFASLAHVAAARTDLALAYLRSDMLDEAAEVLHPLIGSAGAYLAGAARRSGDLLDTLREPRYAESTAGRQLVAEIELFVAAQTSNGAATRVGIRTDPALPQ